MASKVFLSSLYSATRFHIVAQGRRLRRTLGLRSPESFTLKALYKTDMPNNLCNAFSVHRLLFNHPRVRGRPRPWATMFNRFTVKMGKVSSP